MFYQNSTLNAIQPQQPQKVKLRIKKDIYILGQTKCFLFLPLSYNATISHEKILIYTINKDALQIGPGFIYTKLIFRSLNLSLWFCSFTALNLGLQIWLASI